MAFVVGTCAATIPPAAAFAGTYLDVVLLLHIPTPCHHPCLDVVLLLPLAIVLPIIAGGECGQGQVKYHIANHEV